MPFECCKCQRISGKSSISSKCNNHTCRHVWCGECRAWEVPFAMSDAEEAEANRPAEEGRKDGKGDEAKEGSKQDSSGKFLGQSVVHYGGA